MTLREKHRRLKLYYPGDYTIVILLVGSKGYVFDRDAAVCAGIAPLRELLQVYSLTPARIKFPKDQVGEVNRLLVANGHRAIVCDKAR